MSKKRSDGKRRDNKGRILRKGESQEKNGRYVYKYSDLFGRRKTVRSWKLTETDPTPMGKRPELSLREQEKRIQAELSKGVCNDNMTVIELVDKYESTLKGLKETTKSVHMTVHNTLVEEEFSKKQISNIKIFDVKVFFIDLQERRYKGKGWSSIHNIRGVLRPAFQMAVENDWILKNPFVFSLDDVINNTSEKRIALTEEQRDKLLEFIRNDKHYSRYYDAIFILFHTGMRISEFCGLTTKDIDLDNGYVNIDKQLQRTRNMQYIVVESAKTKAGTRVIPITDEVKEAFGRILSQRKPPKIEPIINGYANFLFYDKNGMPKVALHWEKYFEFIVAK